jgi:hypothetical protein
MRAPLGKHMGAPEGKHMGAPRFPTMRINIWIILGILLVLFAIARYTKYQKDTKRICANDPTASVCES